jgi:hypothetical protein
MLTIEVTEEMIEAGAVEVAHHGPGDSCAATAWAVFQAMARATGYMWAHPAASPSDIARS